MKGLKNALECNARARSRKYEFVNRAKTKPCIDCGKQYAPWIMQFDHRDPATKLADVAYLLNRMKSYKILQTEIDKCDVVCANCHAERTHKQRIHGEI